MDTAKGRERSPNPPVRPELPSRSLPRILDRIRRDAREDADRYLRESEVPAGGE
jgi:hypothetical protein